MAAALLLQAAFCCAFALPLIMFFYSRGRRLPPGPRPLPLVGNLHQLGELPHQSLRRLSRQHGPLMHLRLGQVSAVVVSNAAMAEEVLKNHDAVFCSRPFRTFVHRFTPTGQGIAFARYGDTWRRLRKLATLELFTAKRVRSLRHVREEEVRVLVDDVALLAAQGSVVNVSKMVLCLFTNITCRQAFGTRSSNEGECRRSEFHDQILESIDLLAKFFPTDLFPSAKWLNVLTGAQLRLEKAFRFFDGFLEQQLERQVLRGDDEGSDFASVLLRLQKDGSLGFTLTREMIKTILLETFLGGSDTSASATEFAMLELMRNPYAMKKVQDEVRGVVGAKRMVEETDISNLPYLHLVAKEVLRLHPPLPLSVPHMSLKAAQIGGFDIPEGTTVFTNLWAIMRDPEIWENPDEFRPERFEDSHLQYKGQDFQYIPFSSGRRICPGMNMAVCSVEFALANLLHCFDWALPEGQQLEDMDSTEAFGIVTHLKSGLLLKAIPAF
ncbi:cytochrome P450 71A9-like [Wolffia australiana]